MNRAIIIGLGLLLAMPALARPWRYEKNGAVHYTDNLDDLPPKMKARILAAQREAALEAARNAEAERTGKAARDRSATTPVDARPTPMVRPKTRPKARPRPTPPPKPEAPPPEKATDQIPAVRAELAEARAALTAARRKAVLIPDGRVYAERTAAEKKVKALEARLKALGAAQ